MAPAPGSKDAAGPAVAAPNRGGAVLWYLRKHAPMPTDPAAAVAFKSSFCATSTKNELLEGGVKGQEAHTKAITQEFLHVAKPKPQHPQRRFLHDALLAIGAELDEEGPAIRPDSRSASSRPPSRTEPGSSSARRGQLRKGFAAHTDLEREKLEALVAEREAEVNALQAQAEQIENLVATTRLAAARRSVRLKNPSVSSPSGVDNGLRTTVSSLVRAKKNFLKSAGISVFDHEVGAVGSHEKPETLEVWRRSVANQSEQVNMVRLRIEERVNHLQKQTQQRKAVEAQLFGSHAECLSFGHKATRMEDRAQRLAKELRRVYKDLPRIVERHLEVSAETTRRKLSSEELQKVKDQHVEHAFKFLSVDRLLDETSSCDQYIQEMTDFTQSAAAVISEGHSHAVTMQQHARLARDSLDSLRESVSRELHQLVRVQASDAAGAVPSVKTATQAKHQTQLANAVDESQVVLEQAGLELVAIEELLSIGSTNEYDQELQQLLRRCSGYASAHSSSGLGTSAGSGGHRGLESPELVDDSVLGGIGGSSRRPSACPGSNRASMCPSPPT